MTATLKSVLRRATDDPKEVLVSFDVDGRGRNILLRDKSEFTVPDDALEKHDAAQKTADSAIADAQKAYGAACSAAETERASAVATFNAVAESLARKQMAVEDAPPPEEAPTDAEAS
jgi:hypothetical protein